MGRHGVGRGELVIRQWQILILLRRRPHTIAELAEALSVCRRTAYRDLVALQAVPFPIQRDCSGWRDTLSARWSLDSMPEWPRNSVTPIQEIRA